MRGLRGSRGARGAPHLGSLRGLSPLPSGRLPQIQSSQSEGLGWKNHGLSRTQSGLNKPKPDGLGAWPTSPHPDFRNLLYGNTYYSKQTDAFLTPDVLRASDSSHGSWRFYMNSQLEMPRLRSEETPANYERCTE